MWKYMVPEGQEEPTKKASDLLNYVSQNYKQICVTRNANPVSINPRFSQVIHIQWSFLLWYQYQPFACKNASLFGHNL